MSTQSDTPVTSSQVRERLVEALKLDLVGPWAGHALSEERLPGWKHPSTWYHTGFLIPSGTAPEKSADADEDDDVEAIPESAGVSEESSEEHKAAKKAFFPSSMGLSFLVPASARMLAAIVRWGDYEETEIESADGKAIAVWQRRPREAELKVAIENARKPDVHSVHDVPGSAGLQLHVVERLISAEELAEHIGRGTRSISVFLVNCRTADEEKPDRAYAFQAEIEVRGDQPFVPRPDPRGILAEDWDDRIADLHYAGASEYATGHGVSADWEVENGACRVLRTAWIASAEVEKMETAPVPGVELSMDALGALAGGAAARAALTALPEKYRAWLEAQGKGMACLKGRRRETAEGLLRTAAEAARRIEDGIALLARDADALDAFRVANRAVARALKKRLATETPRWRAFQLAFMLLNLPGLADPRDPHRTTVDLLFFPTGGGKTEAYLGLAAFAMVLRRLRHPGGNGLAGAGVSVIMRYTLRLLTLDQFGRAAGLVCALELERAKDAARYGAWPFEIGLWVGKAATPNFLGRKGDGDSASARAKVSQFKADPRGKASPIPLENCPWCGTRFAPESFALLPNADQPRELRIICANVKCEFTGDRALPIVAVDEPIYRRLPAFLIATVDKFAALPWVGQAGALLGSADRHDANGFYGAAEPGKGNRLAAPLPPPDLVIQDELHLIAGPLGTMAGLYETAIEALCSRAQDAGPEVTPKIVASTATVRQAQNQVQALFGRSLTQVFPPPGPDRRDSFFARSVPACEVPARLYLGIASPGRNPKRLMRSAWLALMGAAERAYRDAGGRRNPANAADPYMTVLGYFNSLRELGGARRILEEEILNTIQKYGERKRIGEERGLFQDRRTNLEVIELTSRVSTAKVADAYRRLGCAFNESDRVDCAIATNMISVGLDIPRLGLMVVLGQPKTHAEYIQATSRVGRTDEKPGLIVTLLNIHKPRDRSHYERFRHYHETFYRSVEAASVTPFSARALDRGFAGALVALARHALPELTPPQGAEHIANVRAALEQRLLDHFLERVRRQPFGDKEEEEERLRSVQNRIADLLDSWRMIFDGYHAAGVAMQYQKYELKQPRPLLREMLDKAFESAHHRKFRANRSLRDVEPDVNLFLKDPSGADVEDHA
ncbi:MAG TPA: helicase [Planctomycetes bacterium]|nr:helicase [Planctomycetota bacterium]